MVRYLCEITTHRRTVSSTQLHHFVLLNKEKLTRTFHKFATKNANCLNFVAVWFFTLFMCGAYGTRTHDLRRDRPAF